MDRFRCHSFPVYCSSRGVSLCVCLHRGIVTTCIPEGPTCRDAERKNFEVDEKKWLLDSSLADSKVTGMGTEIGASHTSPASIWCRCYLTYRKIFLCMQSSLTERTFLTERTAYMHTRFCYGKSICNGCIHILAQQYLGLASCLYSFGTNDRVTIYYN